METGFIFDLDPTLVKFGPFQIRYYGLIFVAMFYVGFLLWRWQMRRAGYSEELAQQFIIWGVIAVIAGSRLGHCLFYDPAYFLSNPIEILFLWRGGLSSHGATIGLILAMIFFARKNGLSILEVLDRFSFSSAAGAALVRLGNFFNSEIVGRPTDLPWAVRFTRYDNGITARHPSQIYEFLLGILVLLLLLLVDRLSGRENRPVGLLAGVFMTSYFAGRFGIEFFKEYQVLDSSFFTMGQYLSILPFIFGVILLISVAKTSNKIED
jgi:prolipoprotein diacylglyceryl transferase